MDSKVVNREIRKFVWPALKMAGFEVFTSRVAWRYTSDRIDVVEFRSFNKYNADILGVTTFSFAVSLGSFLLYVPPQWPPKVKDGQQLPSEPECHFRGALQCSIQSRIKDKTIWPIESDGRNASWCIQDVLNQLPDALTWFSRFERKEEVLGILLEEGEEMPHLWGFGRKPSPIRSYLSGYVALSLGKEVLAVEKLSEAVESKCFVTLFTSVKGAIQRAL
jgi:hypothetical protein